MKAKKFPETIYGSWDESNGPADQFLSTSPEPEILSVENKTVRVGVYKLVGLADIQNKTTTSNVTTLKTVK